MLFVPHASRSDFGGRSGPADLSHWTGHAWAGFITDEVYSRFLYSIFYEEEKHLTPSRDRMNQA